MRRKAQRIDECSVFDVEKEVLNDLRDWTALEIGLIIPFPAGLRLDRLLASELKVSRSRLQALHMAGLLRAIPDRGGMLRRRIAAGTRITLDLSGEADRERKWKPLATGGRP